MPAAKGSARTPLGPKTNLKDLDLKITLELIDFKNRLEDIRNILGNAGPPSFNPPPTGPTHSITEGNPLLPFPIRIPDPSSSTPSRPETGSNSINGETDAEHTDTNSHSEVLRNSLEMSPTSDISSDDDTGESEYDFSDVDHLN